MSSLQSFVPISFWDKCKVYLLAIIFSLWIFSKRIFVLLWNQSLSLSKECKGTRSNTLSDISIGRHSFTKIKDVKLHYVEIGERNAPPLLLLHGFPDCWIGWKAQLLFLANYYHIIVIDLKGFGDSDKPGMRIHYRLPQLICELRALVLSLCDNSNHSSVTLMAHDLGGLLSWFLLHDSPDLIERCVIVSAPHPNVFWDTLLNTSPLNFKWMHVIQMPWIAEEEALKKDMVFLEKCFPHLSTNQSLLQEYKYIFSRHQDWTGPLNYFRNLIFWRIRQDCDVIDKPILLITGNKDPQVSLEAMVHSSEWGSNATVKIVDGTGHFPHQEDPDNFNRLLIKFLLRDKHLQPNGKNGTDSQDSMNRGIVGRILGAVNMFQ